MLLKIKYQCVLKFILWYIQSGMFNKPKKAFTVFSIEK